MKKIKVYCVPSHVTDKRLSGVDFARIVQPMKHLNSRVFDDVLYETKIFDPKEKTIDDWREISKEYDLVFFNYTVSTLAFAAMGAMMRKEGKPMILDIDDDIWDIQPDNPAYLILNKGTEHLKNFTSICNEVDHITTTNSYLKNVIRHNTLKGAESISILPNYIDFDIYKHRNKFKDTNDIQLIHFGSTTHHADLVQEDFAKALDRIFKDYPNVKLMTVGAFNPGYKRRWGQRYENGFGDSDVYTWIRDIFPKYIGSSDILVVPLEDNIYTRCKSNIKWLEASSAKLPGVWQKIRQYEECIEEGKTGFLASTTEDWYTAITKMIDNTTLRKQVGENAFNAAKEHQMKDHVYKYAKVIKAVLDRNKGT